MKEKLIKNDLLKEEYYEIDHESGLKIFVMEKPDYNGAYALFGTKYGSVDTCFKIKGAESYTTVPEGIAHFLEHKLFESEELDAFERFAEQTTQRLIYNGDLKTPADVQAIATRFPNLAGIMMGRGLLARPSLAQEVIEGTEWQRYQRIALIKKMHDHYHAHLATIIPGEAQLLTKARTFWEYMEEECGRKAWKKIMKAGSMRNYLNAINELN